MTSTMQMTATPVADTDLIDRQDRWTNTKKPICHVTATPVADTDLIDRQDRWTNTKKPICHVLWLKLIELLLTHSFAIDH